MIPHRIGLRQVTKGYRLTVDLIEPTGSPAVILIKWPPERTVVAPVKFRPLLPQSLKSWPQPRSSTPREASAVDDPEDSTTKGQTIMDGPAEESVAGRWFYCTVMTTPRPSPSGRCRNSRRIARSCASGRCAHQYPDAKSGPDPSGQASSTGRQLNAHPGPNALELADAARPDVHTTRVNGSGVSVVLMVSLQRFWKADLTAGATKG